MFEDIRFGCLVFALGGKNSLSNTVFAEYSDDDGGPAAAGEFLLYHDLLVDFVF